jgi:NADH-quinone oxidoreductase subunit L
MVWKVFFGAEKYTAPLSVSEAPVVMRGPMAILMIASLWLVISWNPFDYMGWLYHSFHPGKTFRFAFIAIASAVWVLLALFVAYKTRSKRFESEVLLKSFYLDKIYVLIFGRPVTQLGRTAELTDKKIIDPVIHASAYAQVTIAYLTGWFDRNIVDGTVNLMGWIATGIGSFFRSFVGGKIQLYIFWALLAIIIFLIWTLF